MPYVVPKLKPCLSIVKALTTAWTGDKDLYGQLMALPHQQYFDSSYARHYQVVNAVVSALHGPTSDNSSTSLRYRAEQFLFTVKEGTDRSGFIRTIVKEKLGYKDYLVTKSAMVLSSLMNESMWKALWHSTDDQTFPVKIMRYVITHHPFFDAYHPNNPLANYHPQDRLRLLRNVLLEACFYVHLKTTPYFDTLNAYATYVPLENCLQEDLQYHLALFFVNTCLKKFAIDKINEWNEASPINWHTPEKDTT